MPVIVIAAGGTGGHMFPAQALAESLLSVENGNWSVALSTDTRGATYAERFPQHTRIRVTKAARIQTGLIAKVGLPAKLVHRIVDEIKWMRQIKPDVVIGFGGYPSFPALSAARFLGIPRLIHEQNSVLGRVNRLFAPSVKTIACGFPLTNVPRRHASVVVTGNPLRQSVIDAANDGTAIEIGNRDTFNVLCFGGSQGARIFSTLIPDMLMDLSEEFRARLHLTLQVRQEDQSDIEVRLEKAGLANYDLAPFFEDMPRRISKADLVIARAGASTLAEITAIGRPSFLVPLPTAMDDHQTANARALVEAEAAKLFVQSNISSLAMAREIEALTPEELQNMAAAAKTLGKPAATHHLAQLVQHAVRERQIP